MYANLVVIGKWQSQVFRHSERVSQKRTAVSFEREVSPSNGHGIVFRHCLAFEHGLASPLNSWSQLANLPMDIIPYPLFAL